jgi:hypothetical protein
LFGEELESIKEWLNDTYERDFIGAYTQMK